MQFETAAATHVGLVRTVNEDAFLETASLVVVADGMGGHACGDVASALAIAAFRTLLEQDEVSPASVVRAIESANAAILAEAAAHPEKEGMGTTLTGVAVVDHSGSPHWLVFNVGDSRVYRIADSLMLLTVDHSEVAELVAAGQLSAAEARTHPLRHVVTRSLGSAEVPTVDTWLLPICDDDLLLVCSDGLTGEVQDDDIASLVIAAEGLQAAADSLVRASLAGGGHDNATAVLVRVTGAHAQDDDEVEARTQPRGGLRSVSR